MNDESSWSRRTVLRGGALLGGSMMGAASGWGAMRRAQTEGPGDLQLAAPRTSAAKSATYADTPEAQRAAELFSPFEGSVRPGVAVGIFREGEPLFLRGYGYADIEQGVKLGPQSVCQVGSVSKQFTAFAVALLAREGRLSLDDDIRRYVPGFPDYGKRITVGNLIHHTSGLRDVWGMLQVIGHAEDDAITQRQFVEIARRQGGVNFPAGTRFQYCNISYSLLAEVVQAVSGQTLRQFAAQRMFEPLGMTRTLVLDDMTDIIPGRAKSYTQAADGRWLTEVMTYVAVGASNLHTTVEDLGRWLDNFRLRKVGREVFDNEFVQLGRLDGGRRVNYGLGLWHSSLAGHECLMHTGWDGNFHALLAYFPESHTGFALIANSNFDHVRHAIALAGIYLPGGARSQVSVPRSIAPTAAQLEGATGTYLNEVGASVTLERQGERLLWKTPAATREVVFYEDDYIALDGGRFPGLGRTIQLVRAAGGQVRQIKFADNRIEAEVAVYSRIERASPSPAQLAQFVGRYLSDELDTIYRLTLTDSRLTAASLWSREPVELIPVLPDRFDSALGAFAFERDAQGRAARLIITAYVDNAYNLPFRRLA